MEMQWTMERVRVLMQSYPPGFVYPHPTDAVRISTNFSKL